MLAVEQIFVDNIASMNYVGFCGAAFDVPARSNGQGDIVINPGKCTAVPSKSPHPEHAMRVDLCLTLLRLLKLVQHAVSMHYKLMNQSQLLAAQQSST